MDVIPTEQKMTFREFCAFLGSQTSERKAEAARENGKKGGRPPNAARANSTAAEGQEKTDHARD